MRTGLHTGLRSGISPSDSGLIYPASGTEMATMMGIATAPSLLARFSSAAAPVPDLAGGDDPIDEVRTGATVATDSLLGACAYLPDGSTYWARYSNAAQFDVGTFSFGGTVLVKTPAVGVSARLTGKVASASSAGWMVAIYPDRVRLHVHDGSSLTQSDCFLSTSAAAYMLITFLVNRSTGSQSLWVNGLSATGAPPAGTLTNAAPMEFGSAHGSALSPELYLAQYGFWFGAGAETLSQSAHDALIAAMGLPT